MLSKVMSSATLVFWILVGMILGVKTETPAVTLREVEEKINSLGKLEQNVERLVKEFSNLEEKTNNISEKLEGKLDIVDTLDKEVNNLTDSVSNLNKQITSSEREITKLQNELEYGGKNIPTYPHNMNITVQLRDHDYLRLQFLGAKNAWLGCPHAVCDSRRCPSYGKNYHDFDECGGEKFQIIGEGTRYSTIKCGQRIRLHFANTWMSCAKNNRCDKRTCSGTTTQGTDFKNDRCWGEMFRIYARGKTNGQTIYNGDVVMLYYEHDGKYVSIQGEIDGSDTSLNFCPAVVPPPYLSYGICSKNSFRIYQKP